MKNLYFSSTKNYQAKNLMENFKLSWGQPSSKVRLPLTNLTCDGQGGNCLFLTLINLILFNNYVKFENIINFECFENFPNSG